MYSILIL